MHDVLHEIFLKPKMYKEYNKKTIDFSMVLWSWRDSNPRPNKQYISFLHAYSAIGFRREAESRRPTSGLSSKVFVL